MPKHVRESFKPSEKEIETAEAWINNQLVSKPKKDNTAIGGRFQFCFTPTSVGLAFKVVDTITNESCDATDYDTW